MRIERRVSLATSAFSDDVHPLVARVYSTRGVHSTDDVDYSLSKALPFDTLKDIDVAVRLLEQARTSRQRVLVLGDFDADGATSCAVAVLGLRALGIEHVDYLVPNRFEFGYGLTPEIVEVACQWQPDVLITVDNGISSIDGVRAARENGISVLITDHHLPGAELPSAEAIVNPNQQGCEFPSKSVAGVGVMFYVLLALRACLRERGEFEGAAAPNLAELLDLVALGTIADVVPLDHNNRVLVSQGLARIRSGRCRPGIRALLQVAGRDQQRVVASDMGFAVAPRLNAAGRLADMSSGVECLLTDDSATARRLAGELDSLNRERREIESDMQSQALANLTELELDDDMGLGLCLFDEDWHQGVVGILASRIKDRLHRPVIAFACDGAQSLKGSGRSIKGFHIRDALQDVASAHPHLITRFGGHAMAAGLTLPRENLERFREAFDRRARELLDADDLEGVVFSDGELAPEQLTLHAADALRKAGPWGQGFPEPLFDGGFEVLDSRILKERHLKLRVRSAKGGQVVEAIQFNADVDAWRPDTTSVRLAYRLEVNEFRGVRSVNLIVEYLEEQ